MIHKIKALYDNGKGLSERKIAAALGISRNSVRKYLKMSEAEISQQQENSARTKLLDEHKAYIVHLLKSYPDLSAVKIMRRLQEKHKGIAISSRTVRRYVEQLREKVNSKQPRYYQPVLDMLPGMQCQVDPGELRNVLIGGVKTTVYFVVFVLSYSRLMYVGLSATPLNTDRLIELHDAAFRYFGGCSEECVYDQTKMVVLQEEYRELRLNQRFHEYATHAGFCIRACEGYDPESKGKVEAGVKYVKQNALYGESFANWSALEAYMAHWLDTLANARCHGTTGQVPRAYYEEAERRHMRAYLTPSMVQSADPRGIARKADKTGLICWEANKYSVPMAYQGASVSVQVQENELLIQDRLSGEEIARHTLCMDKGKVILNRHHYRDLTEVASELEAGLKAQIGEDYAEKLCTLLRTTSPKIYKDQLRGLKQILSEHTAMLDKPVLDRLCQRPYLTATGARDFLAAYVSKQSHRLANTPTTLAAASSFPSLSCYAKLIEQEDKSHVIH